MGDSLFKAIGMVTSRRGRTTRRCWSTTDDVHTAGGCLHLRRSLPEMLNVMLGITGHRPSILFLQPHRRRGVTISLLPLPISYRAPGFQPAAVASIQRRSCSAGRENR